MAIKENIEKLKSDLPPQVTLVAVTKTHTVERIQEAYDAGLRVFGENRVQELLEKQPFLPKDVEWHLIGHLQTNKVKYIVPFVKLIHSVDSLKLLQEIDKHAARNGRVIDCLLQIYIAKEETKFGLDLKEAEELLSSDKLTALKNVQVVGFMGMATNTANETQVRSEFKSLNEFFTNQKSKFNNLRSLSMGMTSDYKIAMEEGSTMVRLGSAVFGERR